MLLTLIGGEKKDNNITLFTIKFKILFSINYFNDNLNKLIIELNNEQIFFKNYDYLCTVLNIFLKQNNRIFKIENT